MDYHSVHGHDIASFDISETHRLPTVSASAALDELAEDSLTHISTGLARLDIVLASNSPVQAHEDDAPRGITCGQVIEFWGPPGAGKTALGIQLAASVLGEGKGVMWVDCFQSLPGQRLADVIAATNRFKSDPSNFMIDETGNFRFLHYDCFTLPHLISLITRPPAKTPHSDPGLVVLSSINALINRALPKSQDENRDLKPNQGQGLGAASKRRQALQSIMKALQTMASTRNCAVVLLSQCATRVQSERRPSLIPSVNANVWENGISTRITLFKDWVPQDNEMETVFLAAIQKLDGKTVPEGPESMSAFAIETDGVHELDVDLDMRHSFASPPGSRLKRKLSNTDLEIPDSEDEDYGWAQEDEATMPGPPPQWQGSEDILIGHDTDHDEEEDEDEENEDNDERTDV